MSRNDDIILEKGQTYNINCTSDEDVSWFGPMDATHHFTETHHETQDGSFSTEMSLAKISHESVGYYYCYKIQLVPNIEDLFDQPDLLDKLIENDDASRVYMFVRGMFCDLQLWTNKQFV